MNINYPKDFLMVNAIAGFSSENAQERWLGIWEKTISEFLIFLINEANLNQGQLTQINNLFSSANQLDKKNILDLVEPIVGEDQKSLVIDMFSQLFVENLDEFYTELKGSMTIDQKQVLDAYMGATNV